MTLSVETETPQEWLARHIFRSRGDVCLSPMIRLKSDIHYKGVVAAEYLDDTKYEVRWNNRFEYIADEEPQRNEKCSCENADCWLGIKSHVVFRYDDEEWIR